jgi:hypothetical protein
LNSGQKSKKEAFAGAFASSKAPSLFNASHAGCIMMVCGEESADDGFSLFGCRYAEKSERMAQEESAKAQHKREHRADLERQANEQVLKAQHKKERRARLDQLG